MTVFRAARLGATIACAARSSASSAMVWASCRAATSTFCAPSADRRRAAADPERSPGMTPTRR